MVRSARNERGFAADAVAEVSEERRADGARDEGDAEGRERGEPRRGRVGCGKEERGKTSTAAVA